MTKRSGNPATFEKSNRFLDISGSQLAVNVDMEQTLPHTELFLNYPRRSLGCIDLDGMLQPGSHITHGGKTYTVIERRHRYQFRASRYHLCKIDLYVQPVVGTEDQSLMGDRWVIGDATCEFNAHSEILRCAVNPLGPCGSCPHYVPRATQAEC